MAAHLHCHRLARILDMYSGQKTSSAHLYCHVIASKLHEFAKTIKMKKQDYY